MLFLLVLIPSIAIIVHGAWDRVYVPQIAGGETLPPVTIADHTGQLVVPTPAPRSSDPAQQNAQISGAQARPLVASAAAAAHRD